MVKGTFRELDKVQLVLKKATLLDDKNNVKFLAERILETNELTASMRKKFQTSLENLHKGSLLQQRFSVLNLSSDIISFYRDEEVKISMYIDIYNVYEMYNGHHLLASVIDISQRIGQLYEKINTLAVQAKLESFGNDYKKRKDYVDSLYEKVEYRNKVWQSYKANYDITKDRFYWNVCFLDGRQYRDKVDLFVGGSPCQSFSMMGKKRGLEDTRGTLFYEYARLIQEIQPKVFVYENVRAVLYHDKGNTWRTMKEVFEELGYSFSYQILNSKDYGIPQNRHRLFVVGFRKDLELEKPFEFPPKIPLEKTMQDFLVSNADGSYFLPEKGVKFVTREDNLKKSITQIDGDIQLCQKKNQQFNWKGDFVFQSENDAQEQKIPNLEKYFLSAKTYKQVMSPGTKTYYNKPEINLPVARALMKTMHKMHRAGVDNYVTTGGRLRRLTPRECLRLMGFSDNFKIVVSDTSLYMQAGNSIVVDVLIHIMEKILESYPQLFEVKDIK